MRRFASLVLLSLSLSGCASTKSLLDPLWGQEKKPIVGERDSLRPNTRSGVVGDTSQKMTSQKPVVVGPEEEARAWPQLGGNPSKVVGNLSFPAKGSLLFKAPIGSSEDTPLSPPVASQGLIFTLDSTQTVRAFNAQKGSLVWAQRLIGTTDTIPHIGGGLAVEEGNLYAAADSGDLVALRSRTGDILWRKKHPLPFKTSPVIASGRLFAMALNGDLFAFSQKTGEILWKYQTEVGKAGFLLPSGPAVFKNTVVVPTTRGSLIALDAESGLVLWKADVASSGTSSVGVGSDLQPIAQYPLIEGGVVYAATNIGRLAAFSLSNGKELWSIPFSATQAPRLHRTHLFALNDQKQLFAIAKDSGRFTWSVALPPDETWTSPLLAGSHLVLLGSSGTLLVLSPQTGAIVAKKNLGLSFANSPLLAGGILYALSKEAELIGVQ